MPSLRASLGYLTLAAFGAMILLSLIRAERAIGLCLLALGGAGLAREARQVWLAAQAEQRREQQAVARAALIAARRERAERQRQARRERRQVDEKARAGQAAALRAQREQAITARQRQAEQDAARQQQLEEAAERWSGLNGAALKTEIERLFIRRGFTVERADDSLADLLLVEPSGRHAVARCLDHRAQAGDVQAIDVWRRDAERSHALLIAIDGFSPQAVRLARSLPITLVEAHLLATWERRESTD